MVQLTVKQAKVHFIFQATWLYLYNLVFLFTAFIL